MNELSSEITTGMSAPPIGITRLTPRSSERTTASDQYALALVARRQVDRQHDDGEKLTAFTAFWPGTVTGLPEISSCSLPKAIIDPAKLTPPTIAENSVEIRKLVAGVGGKADPVVVLGDRDQRRRAAADAVEQRHHLRHRGHLHPARAEYAPITPPMTMPAMIQAEVDGRPIAQRRDDREHHAEGRDLVAARARCAGEESRFSPMMKVTAQTR